MSGVVYAQTDGVVVWSGGTSVLARGDVWDASAPLVQERPDLFSTEPTLVRGRVVDDAPVEDATAKPGSKRVTRRRVG